MNREFLEMLYDARREAENRLNELKKSRNFQAGTCDSEVHSAIMVEAKSRLADFDSAINKYWETHGNQAA